jgi:hypothetical protein
MLAPDTGLTHAALVGLRKQSVPDAERLLSIHVARWLRVHDYDKEAEYVQVRHTLLGSNINIHVYMRGHLANLPSSEGYFNDK